MVNKPMRREALVTLARKRARKLNLTVVERPGRGKGSHAMYLVLDQDGNEVGRFAVTSHARDVSLTVLRQIESALEHLFGAKWLEK